MVTSTSTTTTTTMHSSYIRRSVFFIADADSSSLGENAGGTLSIGLAWRRRLKTVEQT
jgi:hypothetical protein